MISAFSNKINSSLFSLEQRLGLLLTCLLFGILIIGFDMIYITPSFEVAYHGTQYSLLSEAPFDFSQPNALRYRILPSLIGNLTGLSGSLFFIIPLMFSVLLVSSVYYVYRKKSYTSVDSFLFTGLIAFSGTILIQLQAPGYTDAVFYFLLFWSFSLIKKPIYSAIFFGLGMLTHESCLFLLPGLILYFRYINGNDNRLMIKYIISLLIALLPFLLYRMWVSSNVKVEYDLNFYFSKSNLAFTLKKVLPFFPVGGFYAFKLFWLVPAIAIYKFRSEKLFAGLLLVMIIAVFSQLIIAFDITRVICLAFPAIIIAAERIKIDLIPQKFTNYLLGLTVLNFLVFQYFMSADALIPMAPLPYTYALNYFGLGF